MDGGNLVPGNEELVLDILRLCAKERHTCHRCCPEPCMFTRGAGWELNWEAHRAVRCSLVWMLDRRITALMRNHISFSALNSVLVRRDGMALPMVPRGNFAQASAEHWE